LFVNKQVRGDYLNWTIDFKGGSEFVFAFNKKGDPKAYEKVDSAKVRAAILKAGDDTAEVSDYNWDDKDGNTIHGMQVRTKRFGALTKK